jgi:hypothetical protein
MENKLLLIGLFLIAILALGCTGGETTEETQEIVEPGEPSYQAFLDEYEEIRAEADEFWTVGVPTAEVGSKYQPIEDRLVEMRDEVQGLDMDAEAKELLGKSVFDKRNEVGRIIAAAEYELEGNTEGATDRTESAFEFRYYSAKNYCLFMEEIGTDDGSCLKSLERTMDLLLGTGE